MLSELGGAYAVEMWRAWYAAEPRGEDRSDHHTSLTVAELVNAAQVFADGGEPVTLSKVLDHLTRYWRPKQLDATDKAKRTSAKKEEQRKKLTKKLRRIRTGFAALNESREKKK